MNTLSTRRFRTAALAIVAGGVLAASAASAEDSLAARVQAIEDRNAIQELMLGVYPRALDSADWKLYGSLFAANGELVQGEQVTRGPAAIEALFSRPRPAAAASQDGGEPELRVTKHVVSDLTITLDGPNRATASAYWETVITRGRTTTIAGAGHYNDVLIKENGEWKFLRREIVNPARGAGGSR